MVKSYPHGEPIEVDVPIGAGETRPVKVTNPEKVYFPGLPAGEGRKIDLVTYAIDVGEGWLRALKDRPTVLERYPDGIEGDAVYTKRVPPYAPDWLQRVRVTFPSGRHADELRPVDVSHIVWAMTMGSMVVHPWPTRADHVENPDELRIDLDPSPGTDFEDVRETAFVIKDVLEEHGLQGWVKTSGSKGLHVFVRIHPLWTFTQCRRAVLAVGREAARRQPDLITAKWWREERGERVFVDYNRMARDQTIASAYSVRAKPDATVSAPLTWDEAAYANIADFTMTTMRERFRTVGDPWAAMDDAPGDLTSLLDLVEVQERNGEGEAPYPPQFPKMEGEPMRVQPSRAVANKPAREARETEGPMHGPLAPVSTRQQPSRRAESEKQPGPLLTLKAARRQAPEDEQGAKAAAARERVWALVSFLQDHDLLVTRVGDSSDDLLESWALETNGLTGPGRAFLDDVLGGWFAALNRHPKGADLGRRDYLEKKWAGRAALDPEVLRHGPAEGDAGGEPASGG